MHTQHPRGIIDAEFSTGQVVDAAGITAPALQTWIRRGVIVGHRGEGVDMPGQPGHRRRFTFHNAMEIAVAAALIEIGVEVRHAFAAASRFAHAGVAHRRPPGFPFLAEGGETLLCVAGDQSITCERHPGRDDLSTILSNLSGPVGLSILRIDPIFNKVVRQLGYQPQAVLHAFTDTAPAA